MYLLFKTIPTIRIPQLSNNEWNALADLYESLPEKNLATFKSTLLVKIKNKSIYFSVDTYEEILHFMYGWLTVMQEINELNVIIKDVRKEICDDKHQLDDNDIAIAISFLLPNSQEFLEKTRRIIKCLPLKDEVANSLLGNFIASITNRINFCKTQTTAAANASHQVQLLAEELFKKILVKKLSYLTNIYNKSIAKNIIQYLQENDEIAHFYYSIAYRSNIKQFLIDEREAIDFDAEHVAPTRTYKLLFSKFNLSLDLLDLLNNPLDSAEEKLNEFKERFFAYQEKFKIKIYSGESIFSQIVYTNEKVEEEFMRECVAVADKILPRPSFSKGRI